MSLLDNLRSTGISIEIDEDTGLLFHFDEGAFGASPDMPRDIARVYLMDQVRSVFESRSAF